MGLVCVLYHGGVVYDTYVVMVGTAQQPHLLHHVCPLHAHQPPNASPTTSITRHTHHPPTPHPQDGGRALRLQMEEPKQSVEEVKRIIAEARQKDTVMAHADFNEEDFNDANDYGDDEVLE